MKNHYAGLLFLVFGLLSMNAFAQNPQMYIGNVGTQAYSTIEGDAYEFTLNLYSASNSATVIDVVTTTGTAGASDFTSLTTTVTIPAGEISSAVLSIPTANDAVVEPNETFTITATVTSGNTSNPSAVINATIIDNDAPPTITMNPNGGQEGGYNANITFQLSNPYSTPIEIHFTATPGTASAADYFNSTIPASMIISPGQTWASFSIYIVDDTITEPDESFTLTATVTSGNTANSVIALPVFIYDNDTMPTIAMGDLTAIEGQTIGTNPYLNRAYNSDITVHLVTTAGTAGTADFTSVTTDLTFYRGTTNAGNIIIATTDDALDEPRENFTINGTVTSGNTVNPNFSATATIIDNDGLPDFEIIGPGSIEEGSSADFYVTLTQPSTVDTVIQITTTDGTADNSDYTPTTATFTIPAGLTSSFDIGHVPTTLDTLLETNETFTITGTVLSGNTYNSTDTVTATLLDDFNVHAHYDAITAVAEVGTTFPLLANDTLHGLPVNASDVIITLADNNGGLTVDAQGILTVPASAPIGGYQINYTLCEVANPGVCSTVSIFVNVQSPLKVTYSLSYADSNGDGYTSVGDVVTYVISLTNIGNAPITDINLDELFSTSPTGFPLLGGPIANLNAGETDNNTFYSTHILTQEDINSGSYPPFEFGLEMSFKGTYHGYNIDGWAEYVETTPIIFSDGIKLNAFIDSNFNGLQDDGEVNFPLGHFNYEINSDGITHNLYTTPNYLYESNPTTSYNLSYAIDSQYAANYTCASSYPTVTVATGTGMTSYNFPVTVTTSYEDLSVNLLSYNPPPRPGFEFNNYIIYTNNSSQTIPSGTVTFTNDSAISVIGNSGTVHTYTFTDLLPFESRRICLRLQTPTIPSVALGQLVTNTASITLTAGDIDPLNNTSSITQTIVGSWDPNDKTENHGGRILHSGFTADDYLTYTIHFENTGTANAINIKVEDVLDAKLEPSSIKMVDASANYSLERIGTHLTWTFAGIDLPPSTDDSTTGKGYVTFQVKPKAGYALGDVIPNKGDIYFDFNPAIETNTCSTQFVATLANDIFENDSFQYYPNPTSSSITFSLKNNTTPIDTIEIIDVLGKTLLFKTIHYAQATIDLSSLSKGMYLVKVTASGQEKIVKISKD